jgi:hypothetical protein
METMAVVASDNRTIFAFFSLIQESVLNERRIYFYFAEKFKQEIQLKFIPITFFVV